MCTRLCSLYYVHGMANTGDYYLGFKIIKSKNFYHITYNLHTLMPYII